jgi:S1-C subfamily serine protease
MESTIRASAVLVIWLVFGLPSWAQPALDRLEESLRRGENAPGAAPPQAKPGEPDKAMPLDGDRRERGYLGVMVDDREDRGRGVRVLKAFEGSPAEQAGLRPDDLITSLGGVPVRSMDEFAAVLEGIGPGQTLALAILRGQDQREIQVTLGASPEKEVPEASDEPKLIGDDKALLQELLRRIEALERRVAQLERALGESE